MRVIHLDISVRNDALHSLVIVPLLSLQEKHEIETNFRYKK